MNQFNYYSAQSSPSVPPVKKLNRESEIAYGLVEESDDS